jgi:hypothetical protein
MELDLCLRAHGEAAVLPDDLLAGVLQEPPPRHGQGVRPPPQRTLPLGYHHLPPRVFQRWQGGACVRMLVAVAGSGGGGSRFARGRTAWLQRAVPISSEQDLTPRALLVSSPSASRTALPVGALGGFLAAAAATATGGSGASWPAMTPRPIPTLNDLPASPSEAPQTGESPGKFSAGFPRNPLRETALWQCPGHSEGKKSTHPTQRRLQRRCLSPPVRGRKEGCLCWTAQGWT